jgi:hypothetical protein
MAELMVMAESMSVTTGADAKKRDAKKRGKKKRDKKKADEADEEKEPDDADLLNEQESDYEEDSDNTPGDVHSR